MLFCSCACTGGVSPSSVMATCEQASDDTRASAGGGVAQLDQLGGGGVRWSQSESPCLGPRVAPPLITPHATATRVAAAASTTRFCSAARRGHWRAAAAPTAGTRAVSPVLQQQPHPCPRAVSPVASAASTSAPACSSDAQRRRGESRQPRQNKGLAAVDE